MIIRDNVLVSVRNDDVVDGTVVIPEGVISIRGYAFDECYNLKSIVIPDSVTFIGYAAFHHCHNLTSITIPDSVIRGVEWAFDNTALRKIHIKTIKRRH